MNGTSPSTPPPGGSPPNGPAPAATVRIAPYVRAATTMSTDIDLWLDGNEGPALSDDFVDAQARAVLTDPRQWRRYPDDRPLRRALGERFGLPLEQVAVGAGADELLDRLCRGFLEPGRALVTPTPCFPMLPRYVAAAGAAIRTVPWPDGPFPERALRAAIGDADVVALTTPNNPTGLCVPTATVLALADERPNALFVIDLAYVEFADEDPTAVLLERPNVVLVRTFSKACALAGLRVGYALGPRRLLDVVHAVGSPYPCSSLSLRLCEMALSRDERDGRIERVRTERRELADLLRRRGMQPTPSQANFVFARAASRGSALAMHQHLADNGIAIRTFAADNQLCADALRITCPGDAQQFARLCDTIEGARR